MAWTTPPTFAAGTVLTAANLNILSDDLTYLYGISQGVTFSGTRLTRASNLSVADSTLTDVTLTAEAFDYGGWWSSGATVTVPAGAIPSGYTTIAVQVIALIRFVANGTGSRQLYVLQNGATVESISVSALSGETTSVSLTTFFTSAAADTIKLQAYQSSGGALNLDVARLTVVRYAPAA